MTLNPLRLVKAVFVMVGALVADWIIVETAWGWVTNLNGLLESVMVLGMLLIMIMMTIAYPISIVITED